MKKATDMAQSLNNLEAKLDPLFAQDLSKTAASLDSLQQAKLHVVLPYLINDLIFSTPKVLLFSLADTEAMSTQVYLKTKGVDPKTHPVVAELVSFVFFARSS